MDVHSGVEQRSQNLCVWFTKPLFETTITGNQHQQYKFVGRERVKHQNETRKRRERSAVGLETRDSSLPLCFILPCVTLNLYVLHERFSLTSHSGIANLLHNCRNDVFKLFTCGRRHVENPRSKEKKCPLTNRLIAAFKRLYSKISCVFLTHKGAVRCQPNNCICFSVQIPKFDSASSRFR